MENTGCTLGLLGSMRGEEEKTQMMEEYEARKKKADQIEKMLESICKEIRYRLEKDLQKMSMEEIAAAIAALGSASTTMGALSIYAVRPWFGG